MEHKSLTSSDALEGDDSVDPLMLAYGQTIAQQALTNANTTRNVVPELSKLP
jgi:hypothetical protein